MSLKTIMIAYWNNGDWCYAEDSCGNSVPMDDRASFVRVSFDLTEQSIYDIVCGLLNAASAKRSSVLEAV